MATYNYNNSNNNTVTNSRCVFVVWALAIFCGLWSEVVHAGSDVTLSNAIRDNGGKSFHVECNYTQFVAEVEANNPNANIKYHVRIMAEKTPLVDKELTVTDVTVGKTFLAYDAGIDKNMNKDYRCEVRAEVSGTKKVIVSTSEKKFLGIRATVDKLSITEGDTANLTIISTVPILCERRSSHCCLDLDLQIGTPKNQLATFTKCVYQLCKSDWNDKLSAAVTNISVIANPDSIRDGNTDLRIKFRPLLPSGGGQVKQVFDAVKIPDVPVTVIDHPPGKCLIGGDPHLRRFSNRVLHFQEVGDYILYKNRHHDFDVHIRTWPCGGGVVTCVSGVVLHDGNDVLRISIADGVTLPPNSRNWRPLQRLIYRHHHTNLTLTTDHNNLKDGTTVDVQQNRLITVNTPSGAVITAHHQGRSLNVLLSVPPNFRHGVNQNGLCGPFGHSGQTLTHHGRNYQCHSWRRGLPGCRNVHFSELWKLDRNQTLFYNPPANKQPQTTANTIYCGCANPANQTTNPPAINCSSDGNMSPFSRQNKGCPLCTATGVQTGLYGGTFGKRSLTSADDGFDPFEFNMNVPDFKGADQFPDNVTQAEMDRIEKMCRQAIEASHLAKHCSNMTSLADDYVNQCVDDTVLAGDDSFVSSALDGYNSECFYEIKQDPSNYVTNPDGSMKMKDEIGHLCPLGCAQNETCLKGRCECVAGMQGDDCSVPVNTTTTSSQSPSSTSSAPSSTTPGPKSTSSAPLSTTPGPKSTSSAPSSTTPGPKSTSSAPLSTTPGPKSTSSAPSSTTPGPKSTSSAPLSTTSGPKSSSSPPSSLKTTSQSSSSSPPSSTSAPKASSSSTSSPSSSSSPSSPSKTTSSPSAPSTGAHVIYVTRYTQDGNGTDGDACDISLGKCETVEIHMEHIRQHIQHDDQHALTCLWQSKTNGRPDPYQRRTNANVTSSNTVECIVPNVFLGSDMGKPYRRFEIHLVRNNHYLSRHFARMTIYDSDCVDVVNGAITPSGKSCIIDNFCHSDGAKNTLVLDERCMANTDIHAWSHVSDTPINPNVKTLTLDGPDDDLKVWCGVGTSNKWRQVDWYTNDRKVASQKVSPGHSRVSKNLMNIWGSGPPVSIQCRLHPDASTNVEYVSEPITIL